MRDLADRCREDELQIILTTHSPYILEELPQDARMQILESGGTKVIAPGVSPQFAMTKMDDESHPECDVYVEDEAAKALLSEILSAHAQDYFARCAIVPYGSSQVGQALGLMSSQNRFTRPTCVFLDGDSSPMAGCHLLPGSDTPEHVVFGGLHEKGWANVWARIGRDSSLVHNACDRAMTLPEHHDWVKAAANELKCGGEVLWQAMCAEWVATCLATAEAEHVVAPLEEALA